MSDGIQAKKKKKNVSFPGHSPTIIITIKIQAKKNTHTFHADTLRNAMRLFVALCIMNYNRKIFRF